MLAQRFFLGGGRGVTNKHLCFVGIRRSMLFLLSNLLIRIDIRDILNPKTERQQDLPLDKPNFQWPEFCHWLFFWLSASVRDVLFVYCAIVCFTHLCTIYYVFRKKFTLFFAAFLQFFWLQPDVCWELMVKYKMF